jgi:anaerobic selenocysteine-containing dehydrogenase
VTNASNDRNPAGYEYSGRYAEAKEPRQRQLEHWHTGIMTRRASVLDAIEPEPVASLNAFDLAKLGVEARDVITVEWRRGRLALYTLATKERHSTAQSALWQGEVAQHSSVGGSQRLAGVAT